MRLKVFAIILFLTSAFVFSQEPYTDIYTEANIEQTIRDVVFTGLRNITQSELDALINPYRNRIYSLDIHMEIQTKLFALEYFDYIETDTRISSSGSEITIVFNVTERPVIGRINFAGNTGLRRTELADIVSSKVSDIFNTARVRVDIEAIRLKYIEKGYPNVIIHTTEILGGDSSITLTFHINEGDRITIRSIEFQGNTRFSDNTLRSQLSLKVKSLLNDGAFQDAKLIADIDTITRYYHDRGFIDAVVRDVTRNIESPDSPETISTGSRLRDSANLVLTFLIDEGNAFTFGGVTFEGNVIFSSEQLEKLIYSKTGDTVNGSRIEADLQRVADLYFENGYIFNSITRTVDKNNQTNVLSYTIHIVERGRTYIENIIIRGKKKKKTDVILREIPLEPGDVFSKTKVMDAMRNLYNLQFFSIVIPEPTQGSSENLMDLIFTVEEQPTTDLQFGLTFSGSADPDTFPISGMIKWNDRNVAGTGNQIGSEINSSVVDTLSLSVNYLHRWIFGLPLSGGVDFSANYLKRLATMNNQNPIFHGTEPYAYPDGFSSREEYISNRVPSREYLMDYMQWYLSLGLSTGYRWMTFLGILNVSGGMRYGIIRNTYDDEIYRPFDPVLRSRHNEWTPKNSFWTSIALDQRDIFYDPSKGYYLYERFGIFGIFENEREHFLRSDTKVQAFFTLFNVPVSESWSFKGVLGLHSGISFILRQPGYETPVIEEQNKLSVDGMFVGRGWREEYGNKKYLLWDNWIELRFPLVQGILAFDLFLDIAGVEEMPGYYFGSYETEEDGKIVSKPNFTIDNMRFSFGGGLRFTLPQFPFRLSLAKRFKFKDGEIIWERGNIFHNEERPNSGLDLVISFVMSY
jgi:outer membrane protein insertion porin family